MSELQLAMFDMPAPAAQQMFKSAIIVDCWRYELRRIWDKSKPSLVVCMLNPSTADAERDDPTILTLIHFGKLWGFGGLWVVNLFALRTSSPAEMMSTNPLHALGRQNGAFQLDAMQYAKEHGKMLLAAWGNHGTHFRQDEIFTDECLKRGVDLVCLGTTNSGQPKHPLARGKHRIPRDQQPIVWKSAACGG